MNVVLVGYRGTGKSAVGRILSEKLGLPLVSLDAELQRSAAMGIPEFVAQHGWPAFRDLEEQIVRRFAARSDQVIDCGGGVVEREANFEPLRSAGMVIWLTASVETIVARIGGDDQRPSLTGTKSFTEEVREVLERRNSRYQRISHAQVNTDERDVETVAQAVLQLINQHRQHDPSVLLETKRFRVETAAYTQPDGSMHVREVVRHPGAVTIIPQVDSQHVCLIKNFRVAVNQTLLELPAGTLEQDEEPHCTAARELTEETGYTAHTIEPLHTFYLSPGILDERMHLFLATGLTTGPPAREPHEQIENHIVSWSEAIDLVMSNTIQDAKTIAGLLYFARRQGW